MEKQRHSVLATASDNKVVTFKFQAGLELPSASNKPCASMLELTQAVNGLCNFASTFWFELGQHLASALRTFAFERLRIDPDPHVRFFSSP